MPAAANVAGGEVSIRTQKRPVAKMREAAIIDDVRLVIMPSSVIACLMPLKIEYALPALTRMCVTALGMRLLFAINLVSAKENLYHETYRTDRRRG